MLSVSERAAEKLSGVTVQWVLLEREGEPGSLPAPSRAVPRRELDALRDDPVASAYRDLFWRLGIDPTKERPAGEALARRVAREGNLPPILPLVDAYNLASAATLIPFSAFDLDRLSGSLQLVLAQGGEAFEPIGGEPTKLDQGRPIWRDQQSPVSVFLYRDGKRTALSGASDRALVVAAGPTPLAPRVLPLAFRNLEQYASIAGWRLRQGPRTKAL